MLDFMDIAKRTNKKGVTEIFPKFIINKSNDLMIRGRDFYAIWVEDRGLWSEDEQDVINLIDSELDNYAKRYANEFDCKVSVQHMRDGTTGIIDSWHKYCQKQCRDNYKSLNEHLVFSNQEPRKQDYATKRLPYALEAGETPAYNELTSSLYSPEELHKIEWAIGAIVTGASKKTQKFLVLYGPKGTGKSTIINIVQQLFDGYYAVFDAKALGTASAAFALEPFKTNPLVAIQHDGDLSHIEDNTRLNSLISHESMTVNEKHKAIYTTKFNCFLILGTNSPVKITDAKSGIIRRLIDVKPKGKKLPLATYNKLVNQISFELGSIAYHCKEVYEKDPNFYENYSPVDMMGETNDFFNFVEDSYLIFKRDNRTTLREAWELYKNYCDQAKVPYPYSMRLVKSELKSYFDNYNEEYQDPNTKQHIRNLYTGFRYKIFDGHGTHPNDTVLTLDVPVAEDHLQFKSQESKFDEFCKDCPAQYATSAETPSKKWENVTTTLKEITTSKLHYMKPPLNLICIDFDLKDDTGKKSFSKNLEEARKWPKTYAELSKSGSGIHLHYIYDGDPLALSRIYDEDIEIKVFTGNSSLRRKLSKCNGEDIAHISSGLPLRGDRSKLENLDIIKNEKALRTLIKRNLNKEYHGATKPSMDFIYKILEDAYNSGMHYDVSDLYNAILSFAAASTHQAEYCLSLVPKMHFKSEEQSASIIDDDKPIVFFDVEVFPNLFLVNWKTQGSKTCTRLINPTSTEIEELLQYRLVGFNNRRYDNHILYARLLGKTNEQLYEISQKIINGDKKAFFGEAYNLSYTDIYDYAAEKRSLKKWEIKLGIHHLELGLPWDKPVPEELWPKVAEYCDNDVFSTEAVWEATQEDFMAREILADLADMSVNDTTNSLTTKLIFGINKKPTLVYKDLSEEFPGYQFVKQYNELTGRYDKFNMYRNVDLGLGGYVYAEPGMYTKVALLDIASLHPSTIINLNLFGDYTQTYADLRMARVYIKHQKYDEAGKLFNGKLVKYLDDPSKAKKLSKALKIALNSVYGLTSASFENPFKDARNENNIVALRGALFMKTLQDEVVSKGFTVCHIKTDSIKIPNATKEIIDFCMEFAKQYGYEFEHEATYDRICLVNDSVYIAKYASVKACNDMYGYAPEDNRKAEEDGILWTATGTQFQVPYVFKTCFSKEPVVFDDLCETKEVKTAMYLDYNENLLDCTKLEHELEIITKGNREPERQEELKKIIAENHDRRFIGRVGLFCPIKPGCGGAELLAERPKRDGTIGYDAVVGTKNYRWLEAEKVKGNKEEDIDMNYYLELANKAIDTINTYGDYEWFIS